MINDLNKYRVDKNKNDIIYTIDFEMSILLLDTINTICNYDTEVIDNNVIVLNEKYISKFKKCINKVLQCEYDIDISISLDLVYTDFTVIFSYNEKTVIVDKTPDLSFGKTIYNLLFE